MFGSKTGQHSAWRNNASQQHVIQFCRYILFYDYSSKIQKYFISRISFWLCKAWEGMETICSVLSKGGNLHLLLWVIISTEFHLYCSDLLWCTLDFISATVYQLFMENIFIDSIAQGSDRRFHAWKNLFNDDELFSGEWIKVRIFQQTELECGARVCLHGVCFALSTKKWSEQI